MQERKETISAQQLLIGCGHDYWRCGCKHRPAEFVTVDIRSNIGSDIVCDATDLSMLRWHLKDAVFQSVIYEFFTPKDLMLLKEFVAKDGYIVHSTAALNELYHLPDDQPVWVMSNKDTFFIIISPDFSSKKPQLNPVLRSYLTHSFGGVESLSVPWVCTREFKRFNEKLVNTVQRMRDYCMLSAYQIFLTLHAFQNFETAMQPIQVQALQEICKSYQPGFFRKMTRGMEQLISFLDKIKHKKTLDREDIPSLMSIIVDRQRRIYDSLDPTRSKHGETSRIFNEIAVRLLSYQVAYDILHEKEIYYEMEMARL